MALTSTLLSGSGFRHGFSTRGDGPADLPLFLGVHSIIRVTQVHGARVVEARDAAGAEADAIVARRAGGGSAVGVLTADCVPVLLADLATGDVAAVHAGWRGVVAKVVTGAAVALGAGPRNGRLLAAIGPCIGACCFEVGRDVAESIAAACGDPRIVARDAGEKAFVDLRAALHAELFALGVPGDRIEDVPGCTKHEVDRFHSYRRDGKGGGRMLSAIAARL